MLRVRTVLVGLLAAGGAAPLVPGRGGDLGGLPWVAPAQAAEQPGGAAAKPQTPPAGGGSGDNGQVVFREKGEASVYGDEFQGKKTASGEKFDQRKPMAAHPDLPLGSEATITNPDTGKKIEVEIVDRGPFAKGRDFDLSEGAVQQLGVAKEIKEEGEADVLIEATEGQVERAIEEPKDEKKVEKQLGEARQEAAKDGTPQPRPAPDLEPPAQQKPAASGS